MSEPLPDCELGDVAEVIGSMAAIMQQMNARLARVEETVEDTATTAGRVLRFVRTLNVYSLITSLAILITLIYAIASRP